MQSLEERLDEVKRTYEFEQLFMDKIGDIIDWKKVGLIYNSKKPFASIKLDENDKELIPEILERLLPSNESFIQSHGSNEYHVESPYKIRLINPAIQNSACQYLMRLEFDHEGYGVWLSFDPNHAADFLKAGRRKLTDSEHSIWYPAMNIKTKDNFLLNTFEFAHAGTSVSYYGGDKVCINAELSNEIINHLKNIGK